MMSIIKIIIAAISLFLSITALAANNEFIFATAPTHSAKETTKLYTPILRFLSKKTGKKFKLEIASSFIQYSSKMQSGHYDMIFDGPHLSGWRMDRLQHTPIVKFPGQIKIVIATKEKSKITKMKDLEYGVKVCAFTPPNMLTMTMLSYFPNPSKQPALIRVQGFKKLISCLKNGRGDAAVLRDKLWGKAKKTGASKGLKLIATPNKGYPERTFTVGPKINNQLRTQITQLLLSEEGRKTSMLLLKRFKKKKFVLANTHEYAGLSNLINTVWGFQ